ncbi:PREDICTED: LOW QUALITY PROTEIN: uncharacterized protein LOC103332683 [Prunus mume]|uniref:LOW QUALITY PROTEIN: uncharacterized protein LOC103332683 n=1 Tax=Prunus mume TaxID=102107 RepID=A0ABM1LUL5_PRUMU|nr:PREDICTED: LOW QUALITY PROTEIN: uncharacterized protein LOC103332683 [Prunus mume]
MLLGKRPRPPMRRTTSMTGITVDLNNVEGEEPTDVHAAAAAAAAMVVGPQPGPAGAHLASGRDIYMYRGDTAFCSLECREQQMKQDERVEKCKAASSKKDDRHASRSTSTNSKASGKSQTVAAA